ncbi:hypothetical protein [Legionella drancourtii]|uniref:Uncharacterized protein n=1 Tax=Legionella drancourtii LLAP12 TaxID=658187 RepID=G9EME9_9GAMM|nr:hypothetical protein [Legionella drancourtii]EHL31485.1 hypothetical protein LDG_6415 [Legionella drancourtii LLAP12]
MFEYIVELYLQEKKHYEKKPAHYTWTIDNFYKTIASSNKHSKSIPAIIASDYRYNELIHTTPEDNPTFWANFYMAWAIKSIQSNPKPSSSKKIDINFPRERPYFYSEKYC